MSRGRCSLQWLSAVPPKRHSDCCHIGAERHPCMEPPNRFAGCSTTSSPRCKHEHLLISSKTGLEHHFVGLAAMLISCS
jgi:hypothetical protein